MAILSRRGMYDILDGIFATGGMTDDMERSIQRLKDDFDEREGILQRYGERYTGEDAEYEWTERVPDGGGMNRDDVTLMQNETVTNNNDTTVITPSETDWESRYNDLATKYRQRFFGGTSSGLDVSNIMQSQVADTKRDGTVQTWEELLGTADAQYRAELRENDKNR